MQHKWPDEPNLNLDKALRIIQNQFPKLQASKISTLGMGVENKAFLINDTYVFRFPRTEISVLGITHELLVLPKIASTLSLEVPIPLWEGMPSHDYPWAFAGYKILSGQTADKLHLSDTQRAAMAEPLGLFLKELHAIDVQKFNGVSCDDIFQKLDIPSIIASITSLLGELEPWGLIEYRSLFDKIACDASGLTLEKKFAVAHTDLYSSHLLIDDAYKLVGILDWGDVEITHPALDLAAAHILLPPCSHEIFRKAYGAISQDEWNFARLRALYHSLGLISYGYKYNDFVLLNEGKTSLRYIACQDNCYK